MKNEYKETVRLIRELDWENLDATSLQDVMYLSFISAFEFAEALRVALRLYSDDSLVQEMSEGELETDNLKYQEYDKKGDHADFLMYFMESCGYTPTEKIEQAGEQYLNVCRAFSDELRAMSVFSREFESTGIFKRILSAKDWDACGLSAFRYFIEEHIRLDSEDGGHHDMIKHYTITDEVDAFYEARYKMYLAIERFAS